MKKKILIVLCILVILAIILVLVVKKDKNIETDVTYKDVMVSRMDIVNTITSSGEVTSDTVIKNLNTDKYFEEIYYEVGSYIKKGKKIVKYTNGTYYKAPYNLVLTDYSVPEEDERIRDNHYLEYMKINSLEMQLSVDESEIDKIKTNQSVDITLNAFEDKTFTGKISFINQIGNYSSSGTKYTAIVKFSNDGNVKLGMSGKASIEVEKAENVLAIPIEAVQTRGKEKYVVVVDNDGNTENVVIETGISNEAYVEVKSGLTDEDLVRMVVNEGNSNTRMPNLSGGRFEGMGDMPNFDRNSFPSSGKGTRMP